MPEPHPRGPDDPSRGPSDDEVGREDAVASAETMWRGDAASRMLGMRLVSVAPGSAVVSMRVRPDMVNGWRLCHGGLIAALADSAFALACNSRGRVTVAAGFDVTFLEPGRAGDELVATATETALRGRSGLYDVRVDRAADDVTVAWFRGRSRAAGRPDPAVGPGG
ncbi:MAG: hydroxyphenylacetyl-CoA thioesterase PaaI [Nocardioidaceae bacterium]